MLSYRQYLVITLLRHVLSLYLIVCVCVCVFRKEKQRNLHLMELGLIRETAREGNEVVMCVRDHCDQDQLLFFSCQPTTNQSNQGD